MRGTKAGSGNRGVAAELVAYLRRQGHAASSGELGNTVRFCLAEAAEALALRSRRTVMPSDFVTDAAVRWAREGVALETVLGAFYESARAAVEYLTERPTRPDSGDLPTGIRLMVRALESATVAAAAAYLDEHRMVAREHQTMAQTLVAALLSGYGVTALAKRSGIRVAPAYQVVALAIPPHPEESAAGLGAVSAARRKLRRVQVALGTPLGSRALSLLTAEGGTVLIPMDADTRLTPSPVMNTEVLDLVGEAAGAGPTAVVATGATELIPELAGRAHDVLDRLRAGGRPPGLYRLTEGVQTAPDGSDPTWPPRIPGNPAVRRARIGRTA